MIDEPIVEIEFIKGMPNAQLAVWCIVGAGLAWFLAHNCYSHFRGNR